MRDQLRPIAAIFLALAMAQPVVSADTPTSLLITGARLADGSGGPLREASLRVNGERIAAIGELQPQPGEQVIDARGLVLAPGFIDTHNHSDEGLETEPLAETQISQGITTLLIGQDGGSAWPLGEYLERRRSAPPALNVASCVGHATVREAVMGADHTRAATPAEILRMEALVGRGFDEGAICLSSGIEYVIGSYATTEEIVALSRVAAHRGGFYISHIRDEADRTLSAMQELVRIGEQAKLPVQNTHIKLGTRGVWGKAPEAITLYEAARARGVDVSADAYPYDAWMSNLKVMVPSKRWDDPVDVGRALEDVGGAQNVLITGYTPDTSYEGRTLAEVAQSRGIAPVALFIEMVRKGDAWIVGKSMTEEDIKTLYQWPWTMVSSDGGIGMEHPRGAGTFPRVLGRFVREKQWLSLPEAIRKMSALPAWRLGLGERGTLAEGKIADLVLFDPASVRDNASYEEPFLLSTGIEKVWVNGTLVWSEGKATGRRPGTVLTR